MTNRVLIKGVEAVALGALEGGCECYFGYPITPQNEIPEIMSVELPKRGGTFVQAESETSAINMVLGASAVGKRAMTSSSSPGISLMSEGFSYLIALELPCVVVNVMRGGPGLGGIEASQGDYFQAVKAPGHGDGRFLVFAPASCQEAYELTAKAFELADRYRNPVMILMDAILGQMKESIVLKKLNNKSIPKDDWALTGAKGRESRIIKSLFLDSAELAERNLKLKKKYQQMEKEVRFESILDGSEEVLVCAFGSMGRIAKESVLKLRGRGYRVGYFRPITLFPFPKKALSTILEKNNSLKQILVVELNCGQMVEDVMISVCGKAEVISKFYPPSVLPFPEDIEREIKKCLRKVYFVSPKV